MKKTNHSPETTRTVRRGSLDGKRILITRAAKQSHGLAEQLVELGADVTSVPTIEIRPPESFEPLERALEQILDYDWLVLTSVNGVEVFFERLKRRNLSVEDLQHLKIAAIGPTTAAAIESHGLVVDVLPEHYVAEDVVHAMKGQVKGERVLLARAKVARDVIPQELKAAGAKVDVVETYETVIPQESRQKLIDVITSPERRPDAITFTSSSTVSNFFSLILDTDVPKHLTGVKFASIGPITSATLKDYGLPVAIEAKEYTMSGLVEALVSFYQ